MLPSSSLLANKTISAACFQASRVALRQMLLAGQPNDAALLGVRLCKCMCVLGGWQHKIFMVARSAGRAHYADCGSTASAAASASASASAHQP